MIITGVLVYGHISGMYTQIWEELMGAFFIDMLIAGR